MLSIMPCIIFPISFFHLGFGTQYTPFTSENNITKEMVTFFGLELGCRFFFFILFGSEEDFLDKRIKSEKRVISSSSLCFYELLTNHLTE